jgi:hypothetical protein
MTYLTIFSAPKPFIDSHIATIQRNAIRSWRELGAAVDVLLLGEEAGLAEAARDLKVRHIAQIEKNDTGTPLISSMIETARKNCDSPFLVLINADIILLPGFIDAIYRAEQQCNHLLMMGHRWDVDIRTELDFAPGWEADLHALMKNSGKLHKSKGSDYFVFRREQFTKYPHFAIGRSGWDNWTIFHARQQGWAVIDATHDIDILHQQHGYAHLPGGRIHYDQPESNENLRLAGGKRYIFTLLDANRMLVDGKLEPYPRNWTKMMREFEIQPVLHSWGKGWMDFFFYLTHPVKFIRHKLPWLARILGIKKRADLEE